MFITYKVSGPNTSNVYIGYAAGDEAAARVSFFVGANRKSSGERGAQMIVAENGDADSLRLETIAEFDNEYDAYISRNDLRARDPKSVTGPSAFPGIMHRRAKTDDPDALVRWAANDKMKKCATARAAWELFGERLWTFKEIKLSNATSADMLALSPAAFAERFGLTLDIAPPPVVEEVAA